VQFGLAQPTQTEALPEFGSKLKQPGCRNERGVVRFAAAGKHGTPRITVHKGADAGDAAKTFLQGMLAMEQDSCKGSRLPSTMLASAACRLLGREKPDFLSVAVLGASGGATAVHRTHRYGDQRPWA
jgi:hypothetical protein